MPFIDFAVVKEAISFGDAIQYLELEKTLKLAGNMFRGPCPCGRGGERALCVTPGEGWFCHGAGYGGDVIGLAKHVLGLANMRDAAFELADRAGISTSTSTVHRNRTVPRQEPESERQVAARPRGGVKAPPHQFDPTAFAAKLEYTEDVEQLGITEAEAESLGVGFYRGKLYQALRHPNGDVAGFSAFHQGELTFPAKLLPMSNVVELKKRA